tara:strand:- start:8856 stop:9173 length:318 start_codon:yes stop_codon:yes gene_type:complete
MKFDEDQFNVLRKLDNKEDKESLTQRKLSKSLNLSLGKINYCLNALKNKGLIKIRNFKNSKHRYTYIYYLTPKGISEKTKYTLDFMKKKMKEYDELKKEYERKSK